MDKLVEANLHPDRILGRKGKWVARFFYFYTHGRTAADYGARVGRVPGCKVISASDQWHRWPKESYFEVIFEVRE